MTIERVIDFVEWYIFKGVNLKNTVKLYGDALDWNAVFIDWLDWFELVN